MFGNAALLILLILVCPFRSSLDDSHTGMVDFEDDAGNISSASNGDVKPELPGPCLELQDKPILVFNASGEIYSVTLKPHDSILNPFKPVRVFNGFDFHAAIEAHEFVPCLVRGVAVENGKSVVVYGNIFNGSFSGFAILDSGVHHIREVGLLPASRPLRLLKANGDSSSFFASGLLLMESAPSHNTTPVSLTIRKAPPPEKKQTGELWNLYAKDCSLKLIADHTFLRDVGGGDIGRALSFMSYFAQEVDVLFRALDFDGTGLANQIGFRVSDMSVFEDHADPSVYPVHDVSLSSTRLLLKIAEMKDPRVCYVLLFTSRQFLENNLGKSYSWNPAPSEKATLGGICAADADNGRLPNTGFVSVRLGSKKLPPKVAVLAVARVLAMAFGSQVDVNNVSCPVGQNRQNVMGSYFPPPSHLWKRLNASFSSCSLNAMKPVLARHAKCFVSALPSVGQMAEDYEYYSISAACRPNFQGVQLVFTFTASLLLFLFYPIAGLDARGPVVRRNGRNKFMASESNEA